MSKALISFFLVFNISAYAQSDKLTALKMKEQILISKISSQRDSLDLIQEEIAKIEEKNFRETPASSDAKMMIRKSAKLKIEPSLYGKVIKTFKSDMKVKFIESKGQYVKVETPFGIGYIHRTFLVSIKASTARNSFGRSRSRSYGKSRSYNRGPRGGCYYINSNGNKTYVARSKC